MDAIDSTTKMLPADKSGQLDRRSWLQRTGQTGLALNLWGLLKARAIAEGTTGQAPFAHIRSCIFVFYYGGPSHLDTFDMKPNAPSAVRGEFNPIATSVPGLQICEHLPQLARVMDKVAIIRSMHHANRLHDSAATETFTGRQGPQGDREEFEQIPQFFPALGSMLHYLNEQGLNEQRLNRQQQALDDQASTEIPYAILPWLFHNVIDVPCQGGGFLGSAYDALQINGDPASAGYRVDQFKRPEGLSLKRVAQRRELLAQIENADGVPASHTLQSFYNQAYQLLQSNMLEQSLNIDAESPALRARYGLHKESLQELRGQNLLMARRLVEAGVPFINVHDFRQQGQNWDSHADNFKQHRDVLLPAADQALATLIEDLDERGLLDSTLVIASGEFGRTPKINANAGRDHWPDCYSLLLAGGGIKGGLTYGASDRIGAIPAESPVTPADLAASIFWRFGIDPHTEIVDQTGRPYPIAAGRPIQELFA